MSMCPNLVISIPLIITIISRRIKHKTRNPSICPPGASCTAIRPLRIQTVVSMPSPMVRHLMGYEDRACHPVLRGSNPCVCACESGGSFWPRRQRTAQLPCWLKVHLRQVCQRRPTLARCLRSFQAGSCKNQVLAKRVCRHTSATPIHASLRKGQ